MNEAIVSAVGKVWKHLNDDGAASLSELKRKTGLSTEMVNRAIGRLAREDKTQMTMAPKPRIAHIVYVGVLQRRLAVTKAPSGRKVIQARIAYMTGDLGRWVEEGQILSQQVRDGFEAEGVGLGTLDARFARLLRDKNERKPASAARGK